MSNKQHKWHKEIKAWADGADIEFYSGPLGQWIFEKSPMWYEDMDYRIKPVREFPTTSLSYGELALAYERAATRSKALKDIANAAIKQYILDQEAK